MNAPTRNIYDCMSGQWVEAEDYHDASELAHDPLWAWMQLGTLIVVWTATAVAVMWWVGR